MQAHALGLIGFAKVLARVRWAAGTALAQGLRAIIDVQHCEGIALGRVLVASPAQRGLPKSSKERD